MVGIAGDDVARLALFRLSSRSSRCACGSRSTAQQHIAYRRGRQEDAQCPQHQGGVAPAPVSIRCRHLPDQPHQLLRGAAHGSLALPATQPNALLQPAQPPPDRRASHPEVLGDLPSSDAEVLDTPQDMEPFCRGIGHPHIGGLQPAPGTGQLLNQQLDGVPKHGVLNLGCCPVARGLRRLCQCQPPIAPRPASTQQDSLHHQTDRALSYFHVGASSRENERPRYTGKLPQSKAGAVLRRSNRHNRIQGEWDLPKLGELLDELRELPDFDVSLSGFDDDEIDDLLSELEHQQPLPDFEESFDVEQAMAEAARRTGPTRVQSGDLWQLGTNRLLCADATDPRNWERLMQGKTAHAVITDPPYAINYVGGRAAQEARISVRRRGVQGRQGDTYWDDLSDDQYRALLTASLGLAHQHSDAKAPLYLWFASSHLRDVLDCLRECGWQERNLLVWVKNNGAGALFAQYKHWYEPCFYAHKQGKAPRWHGPTNERTVWECNKPTLNDLHPTMKPVPLIERSIINSTGKRHLVVDCFLGSGTAIIAAQRTGRVCYGMERDASYCDVILARWEALTGEQATRVD